MKKELLKEIIKKKNKKMEFAIVTNLENGESFIYEKNKPINKNFMTYSESINLYFSEKKKWNYRRIKYFYRMLHKTNKSYYSWGCSYCSVFSKFY